MTKKALKLPDGGTIDLPIPEGFGSSVVAMNDASAPFLSANAVRWIGYGLGAAAIFMFWKSVTMKVS